jgi:hypothetical protein
MEIYSYFKQYLGPRMSVAGLRVQFHFNQPSGIHYKAVVSGEYRDVIVKGLEDGIAIRFPDLLKSGSIWITEVNEDPIASSQVAFYQVARCVVEQAYTVTHLKVTHLQSKG